MKHQHLYVAVLLFLFGCGSSADDQKAVSGTYIDHFSGEVSEVWDTLEIKPANPNAEDQYRIVRKTGIQRKIDGPLPQKEYETETHTGIYDAKNHVIRLDGSGKVYSFDLSKSTLTVGKAEFTKIK